MQAIFYEIFWNETMRKYGDMKLPALREAVKQKKNEIEVLKVEMADLKDEIRIIEDEIFARLYAPKVK